MGQVQTTTLAQHYPCASNHRAVGNHPGTQGATPPESGGEFLKNSPPQIRRGGALSAGVVLRKGQNGHSEQQQNRPRDRCRQRRRPSGQPPLAICGIFRGPGGGPGVRGFSGTLTASGPASPRIQSDPGSQPRPTNGIWVAITVMNSTLASSGRFAMNKTASATWRTSIRASTTVVPFA